MASEQDTNSADAPAINVRLAEAVHLQAMEGNPLTHDEIAMFEKFERDEWSPEERRAWILRWVRDRERIAAAE